MQPTNYDTESKKVLAAHRKMMDDFNKRYPCIAEIAENNLTMLIPDVWDTVVKNLDNSPPHTRRNCPGAPERKRSRTD
jgi:hypothetical protein